MKLIISILFLVISAANFAQPLQYTFEQVQQLQKKDNRLAVVFIHTEWCKFCKMMQASTLKNQEISKLLDNNFYYISFDAESRDPITFDGKTYQFTPTGPQTGVHQLALNLTSGNEGSGYPALLVLNHENKVLFQVNGYLTTQQMNAILQHALTLK